jgi:hypothetical protein
MSKDVLIEAGFEATPAEPRSDYDRLECSDSGRFLVALLSFYRASAIKRLISISRPSARIRAVALLS